MPINTSTSAGFPRDTGGTMFKTSDSAVVDNIRIFQDSSGQKWERVFDGPYKAQWGLQGDGSDQLSRLNAILADPDIFEVHFDNADAVDYTLTGTLTIPSNKALHLKHNNRIVGAVTINGGGTIHCERRANVFGTSVKLTNVKSSTGEWSVMNFGAKADNSTDDTASCQAALDNLMRNFVNGTSNLCFPQGRYKITNGLVCYYDSTDSTPIGTSSFHTVKIYGEGTAYAPSGNAASEIWCYHNDNFALGIQRGKGVVVENLAFYGQNNLNGLTQVTCWNGNRADFVTNGCRNNVYSPYSAIAVDPFYSGVAAPDRYPRMDGTSDSRDYYVDNNTGGSTDIQIRNVTISAFVIGVNMNPSGGIVNTDACLTENIWISNVMVCYASNQSQARTHIIRNWKCWGYCHTIFDTANFGQHNGVLPEVHDGNVAGAVYQLFEISAGWTYGHFSNVYCENMYRIGKGAGPKQVTFHHCYFNFDFAGNISEQFMPEPNNLLDGGNYAFHNCEIHVYDSAQPNVLSVQIEGKCVFYSCLIDAGFYNNSSLDNPHFANRITYHDCSSDSSSLYSISTDQIVDNIPISVVSYADRYPVTRGLHLRRYTSVAGVTGWSATRKPIEAIYDLYGQPVLMEVPGTPIRLVQNNYRLVVQFTSLDGTRYQVGDNLILYKPGGFILQDHGSAGLNEVLAGAVDTIVGNVITCRSSMNWGTTPLDDTTTLSGVTIYNLPFKKLRPIVVCDSVSGSNSFTNCVTEEGGSLSSLFPIGTWLRGKGMNAACRVTNVSGTTITLSHTAPVTSANYALYTYEFEEEGTCADDPLTISYPSANHGFIKGTRLFNVGNSNPDILAWHCITSGVIGTAKPPVFVEITDNRSKSVTLTGNGSVALPTNCMVSSIRVKPTSDLAAFKVGTSSGADDVVSTQAVYSADGWTVIAINQFFESATTLFIEGITSDTDYVLYKE